MLAIFRLHRRLIQGLVAHVYFRCDEIIQCQKIESYPQLKKEKSIQLRSVSEFSMFDFTETLELRASL